MPTLIVHNKRKDANFHMLINPPKSRAKKTLGEKLFKMIVEKGLIEHGCYKASAGVLRIVCGLGCLLTFGIKRWSDAQKNLILRDV